MGIFDYLESGLSKLIINFALQNVSPRQSIRTARIIPAENLLTLVAFAAPG